MPDYALRRAEIADLAVISDHRQKMFSELGKPMDASSIAAFERWVNDALRSNLYQGWLACKDDQQVVAGGGLTIIPWPPGPRDASDKAAFLYNVYTEPEHRRRGLALRVILAMHDWCRRQKILTLRLHASAAGRPLYESIGYAATNEMMVMLDSKAE